MKLLSVVIAALVATAAPAAPAARSPDQRLTVDQGKMLVLSALDRRQRRLPKLGVEWFAAPASSRFLAYSVMWQGLPKGSVVVGNYAVDPYTADVFSATQACTAFRSARLGAAQAPVRAAIHLSPSRYRRIRTRGPLCDQ